MAFKMKIKSPLKACWKNYVQKGMKKKGNRMVPNCVPRKRSNGV